MQAFRTAARRLARARSLNERAFLRHAAFHELALRDEVFVRHAMRVGGARLQRVVLHAV